jgi:hypothetical protein
MLKSASWQFRFNKWSGYKEVDRHVEASHGSLVLVLVLVLVLDVRARVLMRGCFTAPKELTCIGRVTCRIIVDSQVGRHLNSEVCVDEEQYALISIRIDARLKGSRSTRCAESMSSSFDMAGRRCCVDTSWSNRGSQRLGIIK